MGDADPTRFVPTPNDPVTARRFERTVAFLRASLPPPARLLDLGPPNPLGARLQQEGYNVANTEGDLDVAYEQVRTVRADAVTAFEIFEHLVAPFNVLRALPAERLFATVPLRLWFASAYRNPDDPWDRHFHEFEPWQFDWLLDKAGWEVERTERWRSGTPGLPLGVRPLLRHVVPRWYVVEAVRSR